jgi:hypothetical protein
MERVEEYLGRLLEAHPMLLLVGAGLLHVPLKPNLVHLIIIITKW